VEIFNDVAADYGWSEKSPDYAPPSAEQCFDREFAKYFRHAAEADIVGECSLTSFKEITDIFLEKAQLCIFDGVALFACRYLSVDLSVRHDCLSGLIRVRYYLASETVHENFDSNQDCSVAEVVEFVQG